MNDLGRGARLDHHVRVGATKAKGTRPPTVGERRKLPGSVREARRVFLDRKATTGAIYNFCLREHRARFGRAWHDAADSKALSLARVLVVNAAGGDLRFDVPALPTGTLETHALTNAEQDAALPPKSLELDEAISQHVERVRRAVRGLVLLRARIARTAGGFRQAHLDHADFYLSKLPRELTAGDADSVWNQAKLGRRDSLRGTIVRNAPKHYGRALTNHELAILSLLCWNGWRSDVPPKRRRTVRDVVAREADAMRKARARLKVGH